MSLINQNELHSLLQNIYFDNIDSVNAKGASKAMHENVEWIHTQVWEHDGHDASNIDILRGRKSVEDFLEGRVYEIQKENDVNKFVNVVGEDGTLKPFFGWVEIEDKKIILYKVIPI